MPIQYKPNSLRDFLYLNLPNYKQLSEIEESYLLTLRSNTNIDDAKQNFVIPQCFTQDQLDELYEVIKKFKKKLANRRYYERSNVRYTDAYKKKAREYSRKQYHSNPNRHNEYYMVYRRLHAEIEEHMGDYKYALQMIKLLHKPITLEALKKTNKQIDCKKIILSHINTIF